MRSPRAPAGRSIRVTLAPRSVSSVQASGTGPTAASSSTLTPLNGPPALWLKAESKIAEMQVLGQPARRIDGPAKVRGLAQYGDDLRLPRMVRARLQLSPHAHARTTSVDC